MTKELSEEPLVHEGARVTNSTLGRYTEVGPGSILLNSTLDDYSYTTRFCDLANTSVGKFANIAPSPGSVPRTTRSTAPACTISCTAPPTTGRTRSMTRTSSPIAKAAGR
jgi:hypothetical protein